MTGWSLRFAAVLAISVSCRTAFAFYDDAPERFQPTSISPSGEEGDVKRDSPPSAEKSQESRRVDHVRVGVLGSVAFPRPLAIEGMVKLERMLGLGVEYSLLPKLTLEGVETHFWAVAADARVFPFKSAFFVGLRAGRQHLGGDATVTVPRYGALNEAVAVDTTFINPRLGFLFTWDPGVTLGVNIGVQVPISTSSSSSLPAGISLAQDVTRVTNSLGRYALPTVDLLQLGVLL